MLNSDTLDIVVGGVNICFHVYIYIHMYKYIYIHIHAVCIEPQAMA